MQTTKAHIVMSLTIRHFAYGFTGIFVPIYLYTIGLTIAEISMYYVLWASITILIQERIAFYIHRYGVRHSLAISYIVSAFYFILLYIAEYSLFGLIAASVFGAIASVLYRNTRHIQLAHLFHPNNMGVSNSALTIMTLLAASLAPILGGFVSQIAGPHVALLVSFVILLVAIGMIHRELGSEPQYKYDFVLKVKFKDILPDVIANVGSNYQSYVGASIWPLYIFLLLSSFSQVGIVFGIGMLMGVLLTFLMGRLTDSSEKNFIPLGAVVRAVAHGAKLFANSLQSVFFINLSGDLSDAIIGTPYMSAYYKNAKKLGIGAYVIAMETIGIFGMLIAWGLLGVFSLMFDEKTAFFLVFALAVPMTALMALLNTRK